jgi:hypothetical protein
MVVLTLSVHLEEVLTEMSNKIPPLLRLAEASEHYGLSKTTLIRLRRQKVLRVFTTQGKQHMFYRDDIENFLKVNSTPINNAPEVQK